MAAKKEAQKPVVSTAIHRQFEGTVVGVAESKTARVLVKTVKVHPKYQKQYVTTKKYAVQRIADFEFGR